MNWAAWTGCFACSGRPMPGAVALLAWFRENSPEGRSMGIYNCRPVRGASSMSIHACGRALDWGMPMLNGRGSAAGHALVRRVGAHGRRLGLQAVIYDRRVWSARSPDGRYYGGVAPHYDHLHLELTPAAGRSLTLATLRSVLGRPAPQEDDVYVVRYNQRGARVQRVQRVLQAAGRKAGLGDLLPRWGIDGHYGAETAAGVDRMAARAGLDAEGDTGMDVLVLDYCRMWLSS
jgi:hypothetical protein